MWLFMRIRGWSFGFRSLGGKLGVVGGFDRVFGVLWCSGTMLEAGLELHEGDLPTYTQCSDM
jgi:hypothetical protein